MIWKPGIVNITGNLKSGQFENRKPFCPVFGARYSDIQWLIFIIDKCFSSWFIRSFLNTKYAFNIPFRTVVRLPKVGNVKRPKKKKAMSLKEPKKKLMIRYRGYVHLNCIKSKRFFFSFWTVGIQILDLSAI